MEITKIVITGGPCAGKTTAMSWVQNAFTQKGYRVLFVPETATELINGGVAPWTCGTSTDFQRNLLSLQLVKEKVFEAAARTMDAAKILIVCDRGALDNKAYMNAPDFYRVVKELNTDEVTLRDSYDAVFHLVTAAKGAEEYYTTANNSARTETPEQAAAADDKLLSAWVGHPHFRVIDNSTGFEGKMRRLVSEISSFLGEPEQGEIKKKYLIGYPDVAALEADPNCQRIDIIQTYLKTAGGGEIRIRQRGFGGHFIYFESVKKEVGGRKVEIERRLTSDEYLNLLMDADPEKRPIRKTRYCMTYGSQYFEIDVFPFWNDRAVLKVNLKSEDEALTLPDSIKVVKDVTWDDEYRNSAMARMGKT